MHYERYACVKALGKEIVKRLVGGNGVVELNLTPSSERGQIGPAAHVVKIDSDGSLGELLHSREQLGDSIREKIRVTLEQAVQRSADPKSTLPAEIEDVFRKRSFEGRQDGNLGQRAAVEPDSPPR